MIERLLLTPEEAAQILNVGRSKVYELVRSGALFSVKIGACRRIPVDALHDYVGSLTHEVA